MLEPKAVRADVAQPGRGGRPDHPRRRRVSARRRHRRFEPEPLRRSHAGSRAERPRGLEGADIVQFLAPLRRKGKVSPMRTTELTNFWGHDGRACRKLRQSRRLGAPRETCSGPLLDAVHRPARGRHPLWPGRRRPMQWVTAPAAEGWDQGGPLRSLGARAPTTPGAGVGSATCGRRGARRRGSHRTRARRVEGATGGNREARRG